MDGVENFTLKTWDYMWG